MSEFRDQSAVEPGVTQKTIERLVGQSYLSQPKTVEFPESQVIIPLADWNVDRAFDIRTLPEGLEVGIYLPFPSKIIGKLAPITIEAGVQTGEEEVTLTEELFLFPISGDPGLRDNYQRIILPFTDNRARTVRMRFPQRLLEAAELVKDPSIERLLRRSRVGLSRSPEIEKGWDQFVNLNMGSLPENLIATVQPQPVSRT